MNFIEIIDQARDLLRVKQRVTYKTLKRQFGLDDESLNDLKEELIQAERIAMDENGSVLVWTGDAASTNTVLRSSLSAPDEPTASTASVPTRPWKVTDGDRRERAAEAEGGRGQQQVLYGRKDRRRDGLDETPLGVGRDHDEDWRGGNAAGRTAINLVEQRR